MYKTKKFFVLITELLSGVLFGVVAFSLFFDYFFAISISTMAVIAFSGATHDIACDGVYMAELNKEDQAKYIGVQGAFYNVAKLVANGGLVAMAGALAEHFGAIEGASIDANKGAYSSAWMIIFGVIAAIMVLIGIYHIRILPSTQVHRFYYLVSTGRRIYHENSSAVFACFKRCRWFRIVINRDRYAEWYLWFCSFRSRFIVGRNLCL